MKQHSVHLTTFVLALTLLFPADSTFAHHATAADYDISKTVTISGVVTKVSWANPHIHIHLDVKVGRETEDWDVELGSPGAAVVAGVQKEALKVGGTLSIKGYPGKNNGPTKTQRGVCATEARWPDGLVATFVVGV